ncbi:hypothetical protein [Streptomyces erythrochromogenes]|uniref:hypothetical protein n=1 Tax=Streptomyces erythrochromogenes TaxID=285574 RepID=UPI0036A35580
MQQLGEQGGTDSVARHLNRFITGSSWQEATGTALVGRFVDATLTYLPTPPGAPVASRPRVSAAAACYDVGRVLATGEAYRPPSHHKTGTKPRRTG